MEINNINDFTSIDRPLRLFVQFENENLAELNILNSKVYFLCIILARNNNKLFTNDGELENKFLDLTLTGKIYEHLSELHNKLYPTMEINRDIIRVAFQKIVSMMRFENDRTSTNYIQTTLNVLETYFNPIYVDLMSMDIEVLNHKILRSISNYQILLSSYNIQFVPINDYIYVKESNGDLLYETIYKMFDEHYDGITPTLQGIKKHRITEDFVINYLKTKQNTESKF